MGKETRGRLDWDGVNCLDREGVNHPDRKGANHPDRKGASRPDRKWVSRPGWKGVVNLGSREVTNPRDCLEAGGFLDSRETPQAVATPVTCMGCPGVSCMVASRLAPCSLTDLAGGCRCLGAVATHQCSSHLQSWRTDGEQSKQQWP